MAVEEMTQTTAPALESERPVRQADELQPADDLQPVAERLEPLRAQEAASA